MRSRNNNCLLNIQSLYQQKTAYLTISESITNSTQDKNISKIFPTSLPYPFKSSHRTVHSFLMKEIPKLSTINTQRQREKRITLSNRPSNQPIPKPPISMFDYKNKLKHKQSSLFPEYNVLTKLSQDFTNNKKQGEWKIRLFSSKPKSGENNNAFYSLQSNLTTARTMKTKKRLTLKMNCPIKPPAKPYFTANRKLKLEAKHLALIESQRNDYETKVSEYLKAEFLPIQDVMNKHNKKQIQSLNQEIDFKTHEDFEIVNPRQFTSDYRFTFEVISQKRRDTDLNKPIIQRIAKQYNLNHLLEDYSLRGEVRKTVDVILEDERMKRKKLLLEKWKKAIIKSAIHFQRLNIPLQDFYLMKKLNIKPYEYEKTYLFFQAIKDNDLKTVIRMLESNTSLTYDYDHFHQTILHWMAKRNRYNMMAFAIKKGANINAEDIAGRTPLHVAVLLNNIESVMMLLYELANPFSCDKDGRKPIDLTINRTIIFILKRVVLLYYIHTIGKTKLFEANIRRGLRFLYINELCLGFDAIK